MRLKDKAGSLAAEFGHMIIQTGGPQCRCGNRGCWEMLADNRATVERYASRQPGSRNGKKRAGRVQAIGQKVNRMVAASRREGAQHVGLAVSGPVDHESGTILTASNLGWTNFPLGPKLQKKLNAPVLLDNEGNLCALAEIWHGDFSDRSWQ